MAEDGEGDGEKKKKEEYQPVLTEEPYRRPGRRRRRGPGRSFYDWEEQGTSQDFCCDGRPLMAALKSSDLHLAQGLLMAKADPNGTRDEAGRTVLQIAAAQGLVGLVRLIVRSGADLDAASAFEGLTALHQAVLSGHGLILKVLLEAQASVNALSVGGDTPLSLSVNDGNIDAIQHLLKARAQVDVREDDGASFYATQPSPSFFAEHGLRAPSASGGTRPPSAGSSSNLSALLRATQRNAQKELIEELVVGGAELDAKDGQDNQPLHLAVRNSSTRVARLLLDRRADPNCTNQELRTPMHCAAGASAPRAVCMLVEFRADINREDRKGLTPLQLATDPVVVHTLQRFGARSSSTPSLSILGSGAGLGSRRPSRGGWQGGGGGGGVGIKQLGGLGNVFSSSSPLSPSSPGFSGGPSLPISPPISPTSAYSSTVSSPSAAAATTAKRNGTGSSTQLPQIAWAGEPPGS